MKKLRWPLVKYFLLGGLVIFLYKKGFRITYDPTLINDWSAISAFASWFGAVASAGALWVAINIPKKIAEQQNRIALFDKRYNIHDALAFLLAAVKQIADGAVSQMDPKFYLDTLIEKYRSITIVKEIASDCKEPADVYTQLIFEVGKISFLYELEETDDVLDFLLAMNQYISDIYAGKPGDAIPLCEAYKKLDWEQIQEKLEKQLKL